MEQSRNTGPGRAKMDLESDTVQQQGIEPHTKAGGCVLVLVLLGLGALVVYQYDVPYVDDAVAAVQEIEVGELAADLQGLIPDRESSEETDGVAQDETDQEEDKTADSAAPTGAAAGPGGGAVGGERPEPRPYDAPEAGYQEEGFNPDEIELDLGAESSGEPTGGPGRLENRQIQNVVNANRGQLVDCYAEVLDTYGEMSGSVTFDIAVGADGDVRMIRVAESSLRSHEAEECFIRRARNWSFPATDAGGHTRFQHEMEFRF